MDALDTIKNYTSLRQTEHWRWKGFITRYTQLVMSMSPKPSLVIAMTQTTKIYKQAPE